MINEMLEEVQRFNITRSKKHFKEGRMISVKDERFCKKEEITGIQISLWVLHEFIMLHNGLFFVFF
jgi:hypothetical protein